MIQNIQSPAGDAFVRRHESVDQFRGFAIISMVLVNVLGRFPVMPETFRHARFEVLSFADAVAPFFFFIVGLGFRISFCRNQTRVGTSPALALTLKRCLSLMAIGVFVYHFNTRRIFWDALTQIGFGGIVALPVIGKAKLYRVLLPFLYAGVILLLGQPHVFGIPFKIESASWPLMILMGSIAADWLHEGQESVLRNSAIWGGALVALGFVAYFLAPRNVAACASVYLGLSFLLFAAFHHLIDVWKRPLPHLTTLGRNALVVYVLHYYIDDDMRRMVSPDVGVLPALSTFAVVYLACYATARYLENRRYFVTV